MIPRPTSMHSEAEGQAIDRAEGCARYSLLTDQLGALSVAPTGLGGARTTHPLVTMPATTVTAVTSRFSATIASISTRPTKISISRLTDQKETGPKQGGSRLFLTMPRWRLPIVRNTTQRPYLLKLRAANRPESEVPLSSSRFLLGRRLTRDTDEYRSQALTGGQRNPWIERQTALTVGDLQQH